MEEEPEQEFQESQQELEEFQKELQEFQQELQEFEQELQAFQQELQHSQQELEHSQQSYRSQEQLQESQQEESELQASSSGQEQQAELHIQLHPSSSAYHSRKVAFRSETEDRENAAESVSDKNVQSILKYESSLPEPSSAGNTEAYEYDPYLGLGQGPRAPDYPILLVFNLMESKRFKRIMTTDRTRYFMATAFTIVLVSVAVVIFSFILLCSHLYHSPRLPLVQIEKIRFLFGDIYSVKAETIARQQQEGRGNYYAYKLDMCHYLVLNITNPNKKLDFVHELLEVTLIYRGMPIGFDRLENIHHPRRSVIKPAFQIITVGLHTPLDVGYTIKPQLSPLNLVLVLEIVTRTRMSLLAGLRPMAFWIRWRCVLNERGSKLKYTCKYLNAKWRPSHSHLKLYRTPDWPTDLDSLGGNFLNFPLPSDYYNPYYNYFIAGHEGGIVVYYPIHD